MNSGICAIADATALGTVTPPRTIICLDSPPSRVIGRIKGTPFAASKVGEVLAEKAVTAGIKEVNVVVKGVGSGREPLIRAFVAPGIELLSIKDKTPVPHNGPKAKKPRRV